MHTFCSQQDSWLGKPQVLPKPSTMPLFNWSVPVSHESGHGSNLLYNHALQTPVSPDPVSGLSSTVAQIFLPAHTAWFGLQNIMVLFATSNLHGHGSENDYQTYLCTEKTNVDVDRKWPSSAVKVTCFVNLCKQAKSLAHLSLPPNCEEKVEQQ